MGSYAQQFYPYYPPLGPQQIRQQMPQPLLQQQPPMQLPRPSEGVGPVKYLFIGGFPGDTTQEELLPLLEGVGRVEAIRVTPGKCCCFVRYADLGSAITAHDMLHGSPFKGTTLRVGWGKTDLMDEGVQPSRVLWVGNVDPLTTDAEVAQLFGTYGQLTQARVYPPKSCAFVTFQNIEQATSARRALSGYMLRGRPIKINFRKVKIQATTNKYIHFVLIFFFLFFLLTQQQQQQQ